MFSINNFKLKYKPDKVLLTGAVLGLFSVIFLSFLIFKESRVDVNEVNLHLINVTSIPIFLLIIFGWIFLVFCSIFSNKQTKIFTGITAILLFCIFLLIAGEYSNETTIEQMPYSRVSFGTGFWLILLAIYIIIIDLIKFFKDDPFYRFGLIGILFLSFFLIFVSGHLDNVSVMKEFFANKSKFFSMLNVHIFIAVTSIFLALIFGIPLGLIAFRKRFFEKRIFNFLNIIQTIPSLAIFGMLIAPLSYISSKLKFLEQIGFYGIGWAPAIIALFLFSLLPVVRNTYTAFKTVPPAVIEAGKGMGMTKKQLLYKVQFPIIAPVILNGIRIASVQAIGNTTVAAFIGAGGMGFFVKRGIDETALDLILLGVIPTVFMAIFVDYIMQFIINFIRPKGL